MTTMTSSSSLLSVLVALLILVLLQQLGHVQARLGADSGKPTKKTPPVWPPQLTARKFCNILAVVGLGGCLLLVLAFPPHPRDPKSNPPQGRSKYAGICPIHSRQVFVST